MTAKEVRNNMNNEQTENNKLTSDMVRELEYVNFFGASPHNLDNNPEKKNSENTTFVLGFPLFTKR